MIKVTLLFLTLTIISCKSMIPRYSEGDIAYLKPDSTKVIITRVYTNVNWVEYAVNNGTWFFNHRVHDYEVY